MYLSYNFGESFEYEADTADALVKVIAEKLQGFDLESDKAKEVAKYFIDDLDLADTLEELFEEDLLDYFEDDAKSAYQEMLDERREINDWYGTKNDVRGC